MSAVALVISPCWLACYWHFCVVFILLKSLCIIYAKVYAYCFSLSSSNFSEMSAYKPTGVVQYSTGTDSARKVSCFVSRGPCHIS